MAALGPGIPTPSAVGDGRLGGKRWKWLCTPECGPKRQHQAQTIQVQLARLQQHVSEHTDWQLNAAHIYCDDGYSGAKLNRPALDRLRDQAAVSQFSLVLITAPDRLARKYVHQVLLLEKLSKWAAK